MKIAIPGAGNMAVGIGKRLAAKGHQFMFSFSRDHDRLRLRAKETSADAAVGLPEDAVARADLIVLAVPYQAASEALAKAGQLRGKLIWSIVNPIKTDFSGLEAGTNTSGAEELAKLAPGSRFVAALPLSASVFVCSDALGVAYTTLTLPQRMPSALPRNCILTRGTPRSRSTQ